MRPFIEEGCDKGREAILREVYYLLELGNHLSFSGRTRNAAKTTDLVQLCTDLLTPKLTEMGLWLAEDAVKLSAQYTARKEAMLASMEEFTPDVTRDVPLAPLYSPAKIATTALLGEGEHPVELLMALAGLVLGQVNGCKSELEPVRIV